MFFFFLRRLMQTLLSLWVLVSLTFFLLRVFPGSPFDDEISLHPSVQLQVEKAYGLDQGIGSQYFHFLFGLARGDWGVSQFFSGKTVIGVLQQFLPKTAILSSLALVVSVVFSIALAFFAQISNVSRQLFQLISLTLLSVPTLLAGPLLILIFGFYFDLLPVALLEKPTSYVLPVLVLAMKPTASLSRLLENGLRENARMDDLRTMISLGVSPWRVLLKYNFKKSLIPFLTYLGGLAGSMFGGAVMVEAIFALPGLGSQFIEAVLNRDSSLVLGITLSFGFFILLFQFLVDLLLPQVDPRFEIELGRVK